MTDEQKSLVEDLRRAVDAALDEIARLKRERDNARIVARLWHREACPERKGKRGASYTSDWRLAGIAMDDW